jgi:hypothetical protein
MHRSLREPQRGALLALRGFFEYKHKRHGMLFMIVVVIVGFSTVADAMDGKPKYKSGLAEQRAKGLLACTRTCGLRFKDAASRAQCIGIAEAAGKCISR